MAELKHGFANTNGIKMHYVEAGSGPLVVLCHGWPESWYSWRHQLQALADSGYARRPRVEKERHVGAE